MIYILKLIAGYENCILFRIQKKLRKAEYYKNTNKKIRHVFARISLKHIQNKYGIHIPINTCDKGLRIMHLGPILVNGNAKIGKNCTMHVNVSVVAGGTNDLTPIIGDNVILAVGSVVSGGVTLGDNTVVGANSVVTKSFPDGNCTIAGMPAKMISFHTSKDWGSH